MNNLVWWAGKTLKKFIEATGRQPTLSHYAVVLWLKAQEDGVDLQTIVQELIRVNDYEQGKTDMKANLRELGF